MDFKNQKGAALMYVLMVMIVLTILSVPFLHMIMSDTRQSIAREDSTLAFQNARSAASIAYDIFSKEDVEFEDEVYYVNEDFNFEKGIDKKDNRTRAKIEIDIEDNEILAVVTGYAGHNNEVEEEIVLELLLGNGGPGEPGIPGGPGGDPPSETGIYEDGDVDNNILDKTKGLKTDNGNNIHITEEVVKMEGSNTLTFYSRRNFGTSGGLRLEISNTDVVNFCIENNIPAQTELIINANNVNLYVGGEIRGKVEINDAENVNYYVGGQVKGQGDLKINADNITEFSSNDDPGICFQNISTGDQDIILR
ncbi:hypothetical protein [Natranaerofaba carboxydovora]|uniref:hypothetical protein n=1 Tax=Natranaerofaba carboxydovora TaxID=2742683 RepID=UPI001F131B90|nr:hypothetical protein [Natranaerofaba carboxydovora]UMZ73507.1 hypothetical protein ACONDI_01061 [Natranaerofaba carboxydovora]